MGEILAILDEKEEYVIRLMEYMKYKGGFNFTIVAFTDGATFIEYEATTNIAILLFQENYDEATIEKSKAKQKICLRESKGKLLNESDLSIFKYQSVEAIIKEILRLYEGNKEVAFLDNLGNKTLILSVCSPTQEASTSRVALSLAYEYAKDKRTLFLSFDPFLTTKAFGMREETQGITDLIYYGKQKHPNFPLKIKSLLNQKNGFDYIIGVVHWSDISELGEDEAKYLMNEIKDNLGYEVIVIDVGMFVNMTTALLQHCDRIYEIINKEGFDLDKDKAFRRQLLLKTGEKILNRMVPISPLHIEQAGEKDFWTSVKEGSFRQLAKELIAGKEDAYGTGGNF